MDENTERRLKASLKHLDKLQAKADLLNSINRNAFKGENDPLLLEYEHYLDSIYDYIDLTKLNIRKLKSGEDFVKNEEKNFGKRNNDFEIHSDDENGEEAEAKPKKVRRNKRTYDHRTRYEK